MDTNTLVIFLAVFFWLQLNILFLIFMYQKSNAIKKSRFVQDLEFLEQFYENDGLNDFVQDSVFIDLKKNMGRRKNDN